LTGFQTYCLTLIEKCVEYLKNLYKLGIKSTEKVVNFIMKAKVATTGVTDYD